jgi:hypothetical protein
MALGKPFRASIVDRHSLWVSLIAMGVTARLPLVLLLSLSSLSLLHGGCGVSSSPHAKKNAPTRALGPHRARRSKPARHVCQLDLMRNLVAGLAGPSPRALRAVTWTFKIPGFKPLSTSLRDPA